MSSFALDIQDFTACFVAEFYTITICNLYRVHFVTASHRKEMDDWYHLAKAEVQ
jgi:hypothetical protein